MASKVEGVKQRRSLKPDDESRRQSETGDERRVRLGQATHGASEARSEPEVPWFFFHQQPLHPQHIPSLAGSHLRPDMDESIPRPARHRPAPMLPAESSTSQQHDFYRDAAVDELCRLDTFEGAYDSKDFLAGLSDRLIARSRADPGPFNPNPFIRTFETAIQRLQGLRTQLQDQQTTLASSVQVAQSAYSSKLHEIASHFTSVSQSFSSLESRFGEVSRTAITIGEQLENIHRQRQRALEAHDLIEHYYAFARGDTSKLDRLRKEGGREGRLKTAIIARRLGVISREVDVPGAEQIRETVDRYNERFERDMLKLFDRFYRKGDPKMMSHIAKVLQNFNGGQSCVQIYVNQHDFFISKDRVGEATRVESSNM